MSQIITKICTSVEKLPRVLDGSALQKYVRSCHTVNAKNT